MALNQIVSEGIKDGEVKNADIATASVDINDINTSSGTAGNTTYLRGDGQWATPPDTDTTTPADASVTEAKLNANAPTNDHILTADDTAAGGFKWAAAAAGGATINNATENELVTVASTTTQLDAEANLTFDGEQLNVTHAGTNTPENQIVLQTSAVSDGGGSGIFLKNSGSTTENRYGSRIHTIRENNGASVFVISNEKHGGTTGLTEAVRIDANQNVKVSAGNLVIGTNAKGIDFTANTDDESGAGSVSAEVLNDYERGTWTPTIVESGGASYTYGTQDGWYIKIGDLVYVAAYIKITGSSGTTSANSAISGFPFSTPDAYNCFSGAYHYSVSEAGGTPKVMRLNGTQLEIFKKHEYSHAADNEIWENGNERFGFGGVFHTA
tara:strand:+ start:4986 stop:6137 length:1152 start_codon:yes stop_codon:yes gene_type:complete